MQQSVNLNLPQASSAPQELRPETVRLSVDARGTYFWERRPGARRRAARSAASCRRPRSQPDLHIRADKDVRYERVAQAMAAAQQAGLRKIGFITEPPRQ
jgi:biopolymer transport protein ExbD